MNSFLVSFLILLTICSFIICKTNRPLIAVLSQDVYEGAQGNRVPGQAKIVASYVKYLESAGARVVPVLINQDKEYYETIVNRTDGLLIPGGGQDLHSSGFAKAGQIIWNYTMSGRLGRKYPIWGTCLGFELLITLVAPNITLDHCNATNISNSVTFTKMGKNSRMLRKANPQITNILETEDVTYNYHKQCLKTDHQSEDRQKFDQFFDIISTTKDKNGSEYISIIESKDENHPVYAVQWHPEKNMFEFAVNTAIPHTTNAVRVSQYMADFFVDQTRESNRDMLRLDIEHKLLIYNYQPRYTGNKQKYEYEQIYYFNSSRSNLWCVPFLYYILISIISLNIN